jgi:endonuclease/exonuclease/phosphatase family metal-dependent hydrolase
MYGRLVASLVAAIVAATALVSSQAARGFLARPSPAAIRILTWNVYRNTIFPTEGEDVDVAAATRPARFARVMRALRPDVVCLQEITAGVERTASLMNHVLPATDGRTWQAFGAEDTVILSRFDIVGRDQGFVDAPNRRRGHAIALLKGPSTDFYVVCAHLQSANGAANAAVRRQQARLIATTIRDAETGTKGIHIAARTPLIILGDFNAIPGDTAFVDDLVSGRIGDGAGAPLDWDHSPLTDARPRHNASGTERYTWRNDLEPFPPGVLDRIIYSDSVLTSVNQFVLDTTALRQPTLRSAGLRAIDTMRDPQTGIHDHYPVVIDVVPHVRKP